LVIKKGLGGPVYRPPFGHKMRDWNFEIVENPKEGQYRYLQFYWKKLTPETTNISITFDNFGFYAGDEFKGQSWYKNLKLQDKVPDDWTLERIDLWKFLGKDNYITTISFFTDGEFALDQVVLGRSEEVLDKLNEKK